MHTNLIILIESKWQQKPAVAPKGLVTICGIISILERNYLCMQFVAYIIIEVNVFA